MQSSKLNLHTGRATGMTLGSSESSCSSISGGFMTRVTLLFAGPLVVLAALVTSGCGSSRQLRSVALPPASADAQSFPNGQVPIAAVGTFTHPPSPVNLTSQTVVWCIGDATGTCNGTVAPHATVDQNGVAQCNSTFVGTATVLAGTPSPPPAAIPVGAGAQLKVFGSATLTCP